MKGSVARSIKYGFATLLAFFTLHDAIAASSDNMVVSKAIYSGECSNIEKVQPLDGGTESVGGILGPIVAKAVVSAGVSLVADWFSSIEDSYKGVDSATLFDAFYCTSGSSEEFFGLRNQIIYERSELRGSEQRKLIELTTDINYIVTDSMAPGGIFTLKPSKIVYNSAISARGSTKDIALTYTFEFYDGGEQPTVVVAGPIVVKNVKVGHSYTDLGTVLSPSMGGTLPKFSSVESQNLRPGEEAITFFTPFKLTVHVAETSVGKGEELAAQISKSIADSLKENNDRLISTILDDWLGMKLESEEDEEENAGSSD